MITIDGREVAHQPGQTVMQAARSLGIEIPTLCHDDRLEPVGACRMCLVEIEGSRLMQPACAFKTAPGMVIRTDNERVARNRRFILSVHQADTVDDRGKVNTLAEQYGTAGDWTPVRQTRAGRPDDVNKFIAFREDRCILCAQCVR